jgi:tetratricopeptide (TPR) repeat protein
MNPHEPNPCDDNPIADQNTERLLAGAYRPETPDKAFLGRVTAAMQTAAIQTAAIQTAAIQTAAIQTAAIQTAAMQTAAKQATAASRARPGRPTSAAQSTAQSAARSPLLVARWFGWASAGLLLLALGAIAGAKFLVQPGFQRHDGAVWIDGTEYRPADRTIKDRPELPPTAASGLQPSGLPLAGSSRPQEPTAGMAALNDSAGATASPVLQVGQSAETDHDQRQRIALADGSILYLNHDTAVTLTAARKIRLRHGEIYVEVAHDPAAARFIVSTPQRQMIALGTKFDVRVAPAGTELLVTQGKVQVSNLVQPVLAGQMMLDGPAAGSPEISAAPRATRAIEWVREPMGATHPPLVPGKYSGGSLVAVDPDGQEKRLHLRKYHVDVHIEDGFARTTIDQTYFNHETSRAEGTFYFPLPPDASLSRLAMYVNGRLMEGGMAERQQAREVFDSIVSRMKDPALLEWVDGSTFKMRVFPLEGRQEKRIILSYTQRLSSLYGRSEYRFPGGHSLPVIGDWSVHFRIKQGATLNVPGREQGVECEPQLKAKALDGDLFLDAAAKDIRPDRDIVVRMFSNLKSEISDIKSADIAKKKPTRPHPSSRTREEGERTMFSSAFSDGSKYLMLRWRPELPGEKQRQRRDWIFLFESAADRDPLLARAQVEIVKTILDNAEHDDTFSILTAATRVRTYQAQPQAATPENARQAVRFLENVHLVGALDLGRAFDAARPLVVAAENPVLVHVGAGLPVLGVRDTDALVKRLPQRAAYVGIGVGNRWSRAMMKSAAARSGGYFTQINPNEQVAWRALDLLAALNTPRLLGVQVNVRPDRIASAGPLNDFLTCEDSLAQGEELCSIVRLDAAAEMPKAVEITGQLRGKPQKWTLPVTGVAEKADYLPRTWAKLEIDRLVADGAEKNKARIIELSKAMYVMSPFTSLLVLENEEMYAQYHVDRGRKDHWAIYACPAQIPVVFEPLVGPPSASGKAEAKRPTVEDVLSTVLVRLPPGILSRPGERPKSGMLARVVPIVYARAKDIADVLREVYADCLVNGASQDRPGGVDNRLNAHAQILIDFDARTNAIVIAAVDPLLTEAEQLVGQLDQADPWKNETSMAAAVASNGRFAPLMALIKKTVSTKTWADNGGAGTLTAFPTNLSLTISQGQEINGASEGMYSWPNETQTGWPMFSPRSLTDWQFTLSDTARSQLQTWQAFSNAMMDVDGAAIALGRDFDFPNAEIWRAMTARRHELYGQTKVYPAADLVLPIRLSDSQSGNLSRIINPVQMEVVEGLDVLVLHGNTADLDEIAKVVRYVEDASRMPDSPPLVYPDAEAWRDLTRRRAARYSSMTLSNPTPAERKIEDALKQPTTIEFVDTKFKDIIDYLMDLHHIEIQLDAAALKDGGFDENTEITKILKGISLRSALKLLLDDLKLTYVIHNEVLLITTPERAESEELPGLRPDSADMLRWVLPGYNRKVSMYEAPVFSNNPAVFSDLLSYAPAMHTNLADVLAVLEAESPAIATEARPGKIDDRARRLIERARGAGWQTATIADSHGKTLTVAFDGTGRFRYERTTSAGLREQVACDGTNLWQLYPELGIGARRTLSRFHRHDFARLVPWALPAAEDVARGADLVSIDERTVAIVPHDNLHTPAIKKGEPWLQMHLVFAPDGRLAERQLVEMPSGKIRIRESYGVDGTVEFVADTKKNASGTSTPRQKIVLAPCGAPELKPDAALVVLPLPLRSRQQVFSARKLASDQAYGTWTEEDALAVIAADLGDAPSEMKQIIAQRFFRRGDRRLGFYTLLLSSGQTWNPAEKEAFPGGDPLLLDPLADHPGDRLARYIAAYLAASQPSGPKGLVDPTQGRRPETRTSGTLVPAGDFLSQLAEFHDLWENWHDGRAMSGDVPQQRQEIERARAFVDRTQSPDFAWGILMAVRGAVSGQQFHETFASDFERFETVPGLAYAARYERARDELAVGDPVKARDLYVKLFTETLEAGVVPPIDGNFHYALLQGDGGRQWPSTIRAAVKKLINARARSSAVFLARQVQQVGDAALAEEIFETVMSGAPEGERLGLTLARIEFFRQTQQLPRADALLKSLLADKRYTGSPALWYLAEVIADARGMTARAIGLRQKALEIELEHPPEKVDIEVIREDFGRLLARYEKLAKAIGPLHDSVPRELLAGVIRAADRWRQFDPDPTAACGAAARILATLGEIDLAWDYLTTPFCLQPCEAAGWANLARLLRKDGQTDLADRAYATAFDAEPANAQILWDRAESLWENGRPDEARPLFRQIVAGNWDKKFATLQDRAKQYAGK